MPGRYSTRRRGMRPVINSEKHIVVSAIGVTTTVSTTVIARAVTAPDNLVTTECRRGGVIKAIWLSLDFCGLAATGVLQNISVYLMKNPGNNLTAPDGFAVGSSNEKKFVIKMWHAMTMRNQDGNPPYHWEGWIKIPKRYQRMGTDDTWDFITDASTVTGHASFEAIYKEYF